jgi:hypothetical protein
MHFSNNFSSKNHQNQIQALGASESNLIAFKAWFKSVFQLDLELHLKHSLIMSHYNFAVLVLEEDLRCPSMHHFRHKRAPE